MIRQDIEIRSEGQRCDGWLYLPDGPGPHPCVVVAHGIGAIRQVRLSAYAERFAAAGIATLTFDYRHWGTSEGEPRYLCSVARQQADIHAAIDAARAHPALDTDRVSLFGTSFGGGHVLAVGAARDDLAAVISQCAVVDSLAVARTSSPFLALRWMAAGFVDAIHALTGRPAVYLKLAGAPGELAIMTKAGAEASYLSMLDGPSAWRNQVAARIAFALPFFRPIRKARSISAPLLMVVCDRDEVCPGPVAAKVADLAPNGRARHYDSGHFDIYFGDLFDRATADMIAFLKEAMPPKPVTERRPDEMSVGR